MKKKNKHLLWSGFVVLAVVYLFILCNILGIVGGWVIQACRATVYHLDKNTALIIFIVLKDIGIIWYVANRRWSK